MDIDVTIAVQAALFLILLVSLNAILLKPFLKVIQDREKAIEGNREESERLQRLGDQSMEQYQVSMRAARSDAQRELGTLRDAGRDEERKLLADVRAEIAKSLGAAREEVADAESAARSSLESETRALAKEMVRKILGREAA